MILFENEVVQISLDKEVPCVEWITKNKMTTEQFKESVFKILEAYISIKPNYPKLGWYTDARKFEALDVDSIEWMSNEINPKFVEAGLTHQVFVFPEDVLGQLVVEGYLYKTKGQFTQMFFSTEKEAKDWLKEKLINL